MNNTDIPEQIARENESVRTAGLLKMQAESIEQTGSFVTRGEKHRFFVLNIIGQIEGHFLSPAQTKTTKYEHVLPLLAALEENTGIDGLLVLINTIGGDVEAGLAISEMIASLSKPTVSLVLGGSHSIGVPLSVSCDKTLIVPSATMTLHPVRTSGLVVGAPQSFAYFNKMQTRIVDFVCAHSRVDENTLRSYIMRTDDIATDMGTVIDGKEALEIGLVDGIGGLKDAYRELKKLVDINLSKV